MKFVRCNGLHGEVTIPGDKSISHRSVMFGSIAKGTTEIHNYLQGADCLSTISCFQKMGIEIENRGDIVLVHGKGLRGLSRPAEVLDCGNSGTTTRLISGILSAQDFDVTLTGDASIQKRPMKRIMEPLSLMGASIESINGNGCAPLKISGRKLHGISYTSKVASAQVKSAILLAGLYADGHPGRRFRPDAAFRRQRYRRHSARRRASRQPGGSSRRHLFRRFLPLRRTHGAEFGDSDPECRDQSHPRRYPERDPRHGRRYHPVK